ncbi:MAG: hypothetical protein J1E16_06645 [Muribaculaceae bacterium]|nr:hypothetical protein [Muribaculaceae bacterium]
MKKAILICSFLLGISLLPLSARETCNSITLHGKTYKIGNVYGHPQATRASIEDDIIYDPQGTTRLYEKQCYGTSVWNGAMQLYEEKFPATIVWGNNNDVYVQNILSTMPTETFVKGTIDGNIITFPAGQVVLREEFDSNYGVGVGIGRTQINEEEETIDFFYDPEVTEFQMTVDEKGNLDLILPGEPFNGEEPTEYILCYYFTDNEEFSGFSDFYQHYTAKEYQIVSLPEGVETEQYVYVDDYDYASFVEVAFTDDYIYILGLNPMMEEGVVRAKINGNTATIAQNEYMGVYMGMDYIFTKVLIDNPDFDDNDYFSPEYIMAPANQGFNLTFDREAGIIVADTPGVYLSFQPDEDNYEKSICVLGEFTLTYQATSAGTPANPTHLLYLENWLLYQGFSDFQFYLSNYSTEGQLLDVEGILYRVLVNGNPIIFGEGPRVNFFNESVTAYRGVPAQQMWLPYMFMNDEDIYKQFNNQFGIGIYEFDVKTIGVQSLYYHDEVYTYSDIVTLDVETGEVTETPMGVQTVVGANVEKVEYFNLSGMKVDNPSHGIFIRKTTYSDGKVITDKQLIP